MEDQVRALITEVVATASADALHGFPGEPAWGEPLVGFASGDQPEVRICRPMVAAAHRVRGRAWDLWAFSRTDHPGR